MFFEATTFEGSCVVSFHIGKKKLLVYFSLHESSLHLWRRENHLNTVYEKWI